MDTTLATTVQGSVTGLGGWFAANQTRLLAALVLLAVGFALAILLRAIAVRLGRALERTLPGRETQTSFGGVVRERRISAIVGAVVFWTVLLFFAATAADALGIPLVSAVVASLSLVVPRVLVAVAILVAGLVIGNVARGTVTAAAARAGSAYGRTLGGIARLAIVVAAVLLAIAELGVDISLVTTVLAVVLAALLGAFALAFGLGARTAIANIIGSHYLRQSFEVGQTVRIAGIEGTIAALTATAVVVDGAEGRTIIPARLFGEAPASLVVRGRAA
ncbi:MAG TPA: hypothetical protein VFZ11_14665 [Gemmatimonadaceae bacterium]